MPLRNRTSRTELSVGLALSLLACSVARSEPPEIQRIEPLGLVRGGTTELELRGERLDGELTVWTSCGGVFEAIDSGADSASRSRRFRATLPADVAIGPASLRVLGKNGLSEPVWVLVDDLPARNVATDRRSLATAPRIEPGSAVDGVGETEKLHYYRFRLDATQSVSFEVVAQRIGSLFDPTVTLLAGDGLRVQTWDDVGGLDADCRAAIELAAGEYALVVRDAYFQGGSRSPYRLRLGSFPVATAAFPPLVRAASPSLATVTADTSASHVGETTPLSTGYGGAFASVPGSVGSSFVPLLRSPYRLHVEEADAAATGDDATELPLPSVIAGRFDVAGDVDVYRFVLRKGQRVALRAHTRELGSPAIIDARWVGPGGKTLERTDPGNAQADGIVITAEEAGDHFLELRELIEAGGPSCVYAIEVWPRARGARLATGTTTLFARPGDTVKIEVRRAKGDDLVALACHLATDDPWLELVESAVPAKKEKAQLALRVRDDAPVRVVTSFRLLARPQDEPQAATTVVSTTDYLRKRFGRMLHPPPLLQGSIQLGVWPSD